MILFPNFLTDETEYKAAEQFWQSLWAQLAAPSHWFTPWLNTAYADGQPFRDGNPIFSACSLVADRAVRLIQMEAEDSDEVFTWWGAATEHTDGRALSCLVISCVLTDATANRARSLLEQWAVLGKDASQLCENAE